MKAFKNIILFGILVFSLSTLPIYFSPINFSNVIDLDNGSNLGNTNFSLKSVEGNTLRDPENLNLIVETNSEKSLSFFPENMLEMQVYKNEELVNVENLEYTYREVSLSREKPLDISLNISRENLDLSYGEYEFIFYISGEEIREKLNIKVNYSLQGNYYKASNENNGLTGIRLYFKSKDDFLVPVYRFVQNYNSLHNIIEAELLKGPKNEDLLSPIGNINYLIYRDRVVYIDLPTNDEVYTGENGQIAYYCFVKSLSQVPNADKIRFIFDDQVRETYFNGINIRYAMDFPNNPKAFVPILVGDRFYLREEDVFVEDDSSLEEKAEAIYSHLIKNEFLQDLNSTEINSISLQGDTINIDFNGFSNVSLGDSLDNMLIESLLYSFTSMDNINSVYLTENTQPLGVYGDYDLSEIIYPYEYFNLESID